jgi:ATPase subunit of ABC transporter with duplicated ATPase domains
MINIAGLDYRYGSQILFDDAGAKVESGWTVGLIGPNGSGKTTLFRLITGEEHHEVGEVAVPSQSRIGYFDQKVGEMSGCDVVEQAIRSAGRVSDLRQILVDLEHDLGDPDKADDLDRIMAQYCRAQAEFQVLGGYDIEPRAREILGGLGFSKERMHEDVAVLSGGWKMRVSLAGVLLQQPDILLLDEPTNHLDLETILWLEGFIREFRGTVLMTCHDHEFMNRVVDRIMEIDEGKLRLFPGDYDFYLAQRALEDEQRHAAFSRQQGHIEREMRWINSFRAKARSAGQAQSRLRALGKLDKLEVPRSRRKKVVFRIPPTTRSGNDIFVADEITKSYGDLDVLLGLNFHLRRQERWAVMGINGAGKSTLLKIIHGDVQPDSGKWKLGASLKVGYFAQHSTDLLHPKETVIGTMQAKFSGDSIGALRKCLAGFGFDDIDMDKVTSWLSGGEKSKLVMALMLFRPPNFLILDEPTNHLDVESKQSLLDALDRYDGTIIFVSHDRHFLEAVANHVLEIDGGVATAYRGSYHQYVQQSGHAAPGAG